MYMCSERTLYFEINNIPRYNIMLCGIIQVEKYRERKNNTI